MRVKLSHKAGFTVLELLIASTVFSVILLLCLVGITRMGRLYYKGLSQSQAQEVTRRISEEITTQIQFGKLNVSSSNITSDGKTGGSTIVFCVGDYRYRVVLNRQLDTVNDATLKKSTTVLLRGQNNGGCNPDPTVSTPNEEELLVRGMRVSRINIKESSSVSRTWTVDFQITYGDDDLLEYPDVASLTTDAPERYQTVICKGGTAGAELCATSSITTTVLRRLP